MTSMVRILFGLLLLGCTASQAKAQMDDSIAHPQVDIDEPIPTRDTSEHEPEETDKIALQELISRINADDEVSQSLAQPDADESIGAPALTAATLWGMSDKQCLNLLDRNGVKTSVPPFKTPFVRTPLLLESPVNGVEVLPKWVTQQKGMVMDCRLIGALIEVCRFAKQHGIVRIEYYSAWRPIKTSAGSCKSGKKGKSCRKRKEAWKRAKQGNLPSQHNRATGIDIRWFTLEDGQVVDVLFDYERNFKQPPCIDEPSTWQAIFLKEIACHLSRTKTFNVILTPNADEAHDNHFHLDITPGAGWYIIR